jgi:hypothetical protein
MEHKRDFTAYLLRPDVVTAGAEGGRKLLSLYKV